MADLMLFQFSLAKNYRFHFDMSRGDDQIGLDAVGETAALVGFVDDEVLPIGRFCPLFPREYN